MTEAQPTGPEIDDVFMAGESGPRQLPLVRILKASISILSIIIPKMVLIFPD